MKQSRKFLVAAVLLMGAVLAPSLAFAMNAGDVAENLRGQTSHFGDLVIAAMYLSGIGLGGLAALKFKAHNEDPRNTKITTPIVFALAAAMLVALPSFLGLSRETLLQGGGSNGTFDQGGNGYVTTP